MKTYIILIVMLLCGGCSSIPPTRLTISRGFYPDALDHNGTTVSVSVSLFGSH